MSYSSETKIQTAILMAKCESSIIVKFVNDDGKKQRRFQNVILLHLSTKNYLKPVELKATFVPEDHQEVQMI